MIMADSGTSTSRKARMTIEGHHDGPRGAIYNPETREAKERRYRQLTTTLTVIMAEMRLLSRELGTPH